MAGRQSIVAILGAVTFVQGGLPDGTLLAGGQSAATRLTKAFQGFEALGVPRLLDVEDLIGKGGEELTNSTLKKSITMYLAVVYGTLMRGGDTQATKPRNRDGVEPRSREGSTIPDNISGQNCV